jgi:hypothetical protein
MVAVAFIEQRRQSVEGVGRNLLEFVSLHDVSSVRWAVCGSFTPGGAQQPIGGHVALAVPSVAVHIVGRASRSLLARSGATVERGRATRDGAVVEADEFIDRSQPANAAA